MSTKTLECSSKGDTRFSAFSAKVKVFGKEDSIENHYQLSKRFLVGGFEVRPQTFRDAKGKAPDFFSVGEMNFPTDMLGQWYKMLWLKYLDEHPELVAYAKGFDEFTDMFRGKAINCQADAIRQYVKEGRESILRDCLPFLDVLKSG